MEYPNLEYAQRFQCLVIILVDCILVKHLQGRLIVERLMKLKPPIIMHPRELIQFECFECLELKICLITQVPGVAVVQFQTLIRVLGFHLLFWFRCNIRCNNKVELIKELIGYHLIWRIIGGYKDQSAHLWWVDIGKWKVCKMDVRQNHKNVRSVSWILKL